MGFYCGGKYVSDSDFGDASVVCALDKYTGRQVSLKRWRAEDPGAGCEPEIWNLVYPEMFIESCAEDGYVYLVREWIKGETLYEYCLNHGSLSESEIYIIFEKVCSALLNFYSALSMVHCDIKPENIIISGESVLLIDFEAAQEEAYTDCVRGRRGAEACEMKTVRFASRDYCAPEVYHGEVSFSSDIYSLGVLLLFMFTGSTKNSALRLLPPDAYEICTRCMNIEVKKRYGSLRELCAELKISRLRTETVLDEPNNVISVQNMTVNAKNVNYSTGKSPDVDETGCVDSDKRKNEPANVVVFPKSLAGYRRVILYVPGNAAFAAEFAFMTAKMFGMRTAVFDVDEVYTDRMKYFLPFEKVSSLENEGFVAAEGDLRRETLFLQNFSHGFFASEEKDWVRSGMITKSTLSENLFVSLYNVIKELEMDSFGLRSFASWCYSMFDVTIVSDSGRMYGLNEEVMRVCDYVIVPVEANIDDVIFNKKFFALFMEKIGVSLSKLRYVGWNYAERESVEHENMVATLGEKIYLGTVKRDSMRQTVRNLKGRSFCETDAQYMKAQYGRIIQNLLFGLEMSA